jgi:outer membrane lipoprotein-sorting protein
VTDSYSQLLFIQQLSQSIGQGYRAVLAPGTADSHHQGGFTLFNIIGQQKFKKIGILIHKLRGDLRGEDKVTHLFIVTGADGKEQSKMWVRTDYGIPIRIESVDPSEEKTIMEFKNLKIGKQPADTFQLPAGVEIIDASDLFNNLPR